MDVEEWRGNGDINLTCSTIPDINTSCCQKIHVMNKWDSGSDYQIGGTFEGKSFWGNNATNYAIWYDGDSGADFDWVFGKAEDMQNHGGEMFSDKKSTCPTDITEWTMITPQRRRFLTGSKLLHQILPPK